MDIMTALFFLAMGAAGYFQYQNRKLKKEIDMRVHMMDFVKATLVGATKMFDELQSCFETAIEEGTASDEANNIRRHILMNQKSHALAKKIVDKNISKAELAAELEGLVKDLKKIEDEHPRRNTKTRD